MKRILDWRLLTALLVFVFGMVVTSCGGNPDGGVAVDLGLPSGTLWADRNIGADSSEDGGDYLPVFVVTTNFTDLVLNLVLE